VPDLLASIIDLGGNGRYVHWGWVQISVANLVVIGIMLVLFVLALLLPFPHGRRTEQVESPAAPTATAATEPESEA
jgi:hypothetical protein